MGQSSSRAASTTHVVDDDKFDASARTERTAAELLASLSIKSGKALPSAGITLASIDDWDAKFASDSKNKLAATVLHKTDFLGALVQRMAVVDDLQVFNVKLSHEGTPVQNQKSSGRCWLFATCGTLRIPMMKKYKLPSFELSQSYLFFYDSLSKANYFLENMLELADAPIDDRTVVYLMVSPENDGGQFEMAINLVERFGLVPQAVYPESFHSSNSGKLDQFLTSKLREYALELRALHAASMRALNEVSPNLTHAERHERASQGARKRKEEQMEEIYRILAITLGSPPKANEKFVWEYYDTNNKYHKIETTPLQFYKEYATLDLSQNISIINDPRNKYDELYTVKRLGNVWDGRPIRYVNTDIQVLKDVAIALLKADTPVWFGCDVGKSSSSALGLMDTQLFDLEGAFGTTVRMTKAERLLTGDSEMTHAMVLTGVHLDDAGKSVRWRVENSWSDAAGDKGYFLMSDDWFSEHVFQVVAHRSYVPKRLVEIRDTHKAVELEAWDPMGSLA